MTKTSHRTVKLVLSAGGEAFSFTVPLRCRLRSESYYVNAEISFVLYARSRCTVCSLFNVHPKLFLSSAL